MGSPMTIAEKILSAHCGRPAYADEIVFCTIDSMMIHDATGPLVLKAFGEMEGKAVLHPEKICIVLDHCSPAPTEKISNLQRELREFATAHGIRLYDWGEGVCHQLMLESGEVRAGNLVLGTDSHTCSYGAVGAFATGVGATDMAAAFICGKSWFKVPPTIRVELEGALPQGCEAKDIILTLIGEVGADGGNYLAFELYGDYLENCRVADRITIANMIVEMGGKTGFVCHSSMGIEADPGARYERTVRIALPKVAPSAARPHTVDNWAPVTALEGLAFQYGYLGSCTNGRIEDLRAAADILRGKRISPNVRLLVVPASKAVFSQAMEEGVLAALMEAGASVFPPGCAACVGTHGGVPADGEVVLSTANRNFKGRMGNNKASIYLVSPTTLAASCLTGVVTDPRGKER